MSGLLHALGFLTRFPLPRTKPPSEDDLVAAAGWFPLAGAAVGAAVALAFLVGERLFGSLPAAALAVAAGILASGGLHLDALADTADGLGCGGDRERMLAVMRDARVGAHGATAIAMDVVLKAAFLAALGPAAPAAAIAAGALSRWAMVLVMPLHPYARPGPGLGRTFAARVGGRQVVSATLLAGALALAASRLTASPALAMGAPGEAAVVAPAAAAMLVAAVVALTVAWQVARRLGGLTGDVYGAINEVVEILVLAVFLFFARGLA